MARTFAAQGVPTWHYRFSYVAASARTPATKGAAHASEIPYFFDTVGIKYGAATTVQDRAIGRIASAYLVDFVKTGDPNGARLPRWDRYDATARATMDMGAGDGARQEADSWDKDAR
ncbi:carboxylesterase family protein [Sphingobium sp. CAP-1]|uniref:carboxylesterase family protein n=1 Tax=Sphingobium sp. CAP-1 TaxID=2676077 RepID=UPI002E35DA89|nr:carboxylesterase family protein [Sphingobium sp. CAP-1]